MKASKLKFLTLMTLLSFSLLQTAGAKVYDFTVVKKYQRSKKIWGIYHSSKNDPAADNVIVKKNHLHYIYSTKDGAYSDFKVAKIPFNRKSKRNLKVAGNQNELRDIHWPEILKLIRNTPSLRRIQKHIKRDHISIHDNNCYKKWKTMTCKFQVKIKRPVNKSIALNK
jgi:hypothetical protein